MNRDLFSLCTLGFLHTPLAEAVTAIADAGFSQVEIISVPPHILGAPESADFEALRRLLKATGVRVRTVHAPMRKNILGAPGEAWRMQAVDVFSASFGRARDLGADDLIVHPVPNPIFVAEAETPDLHRRIGEAVSRSLEQLLPVAERTGVRLLLENLPYACGYPLRSIAELRAEIDSYPARHVGLVVDTGHAVLAGQGAAEEIRTAGRRLLGVHLHDNDGKDDKHWVPGDGVIDWSAVHRALAEVAYTGPWTFEVSDGRGDETPEQLARRTREVAERWQREGVTTRPHGAAMSDDSQ